MLSGLPRENVAECERAIVLHVVTQVRLCGVYQAISTTPAASEGQVSPGETPTPVDQRSAELYCRERFVVEDYEVLGTDEDFPRG